MMTDPVSDMLTRIRNALSARHESVVLPFSKLKHNLALILQRENYIKSVNQISVAGNPFIEIKLEYKNNGIPKISHIARISKPGRRVYSGKDELPRVLNGYGIAIVSTPQGLLTNKEAKKRGVGGEIICEVY